MNFEAMGSFQPMAGLYFPLIIKPWKFAKRQCEQHWLTPPKPRSHPEHPRHQRDEQLVLPLAHRQQQQLEQRPGQLQVRGAVLQHLDYRLLVVELLQDAGFRV